MAKSGAKSGTTRSADTTRQRVVEAAIETLKSEGYAGTSARAIAGAGGFAQGVIFYHFGDVHRLLLAALDATGTERLARYQDAVETVTDPGDLLRVAGDLLREDLESGHITVLAELIAGASSSPDLGPEVAARVAPWLDLVESVLRPFLAGSPLEHLVPPRDLAFAIVSLYLGMEILTHLDEGSGDRAADLFDTASRLLPLAAPLLSGRPRHDGP